MNRVLCVKLLLCAQMICCAAEEQPSSAPYLVVLGTAQDGGYPQAGCRKLCCQRVLANPNQHRFVASAAIVDPQTHQRWLIECTPDFPQQLQMLDAIAEPKDKLGIDGILLTHAHIGHYAGLVHLGREVMGTDRVPVYAMPRMRRFLRAHGPWNQLVDTNNIELRELEDGKTQSLGQRVQVTPMLVPHRDEYSETVGFMIRGPNRSAFFLPDIDKWERWQHNIAEVIAKVDVAYVDGTFFANGELPGRDMSKIPHPFIKESIERFAELPEPERNKIRFLHLNHTNPVLNPDSKEAATVRAAGHHIADQGERFAL